MPESLVKKETLAQVFSCEFCELSKNTFFIEHLWATASDYTVLGTLISDCYICYNPNAIFYTILSQNKFSLKILLRFTLNIITITIKRLQSTHIFE